MDMGPNSPFWMMFFWADVVVCVALGIWIALRLGKEKKQLRDAFKGYYLRQMKWLFLNKLKDSGEQDEKTNSRN
ncbi:MAG: hypothetical protein V1882_06990 [Candidatus Omnitrophota bacterium]